MDKLVQSLGITGLSKGQVSEMARDLDGHVEQFRSRRLDGPFTFVAADALVLKVAKAAGSSGCTPWSRPGTMATGHREILGLHVTTVEDGAGVAGVLPATSSSSALPQGLTLQR